MSSCIDVMKYDVILQKEGRQSHQSVFTSRHHLSQENAVKASISANIICDKESAKRKGNKIFLLKTYQYFIRKSVKTYIFSTNVVTRKGKCICRYRHQYNKARCESITFANKRHLSQARAVMHSSLQASLLQGRQKHSSLRTTAVILSQEMEVNAPTSANATRHTQG